MNTNKVIKVLGIIAGILLIMAIITAILNFILVHKFNNNIKDITGIDISVCKEIKYEDTHEGFPADGDNYIEWDCSNTRQKINTNTMKKLPFPNNIELALYENNINDVIYGYEFGTKHGMPKIDRGYYYFNDDYCSAYNDIEDCSSPEKLIDENRPAFNFTLIAFDSATEHLYYLEIDT